MERLPPNPPYIGSQNFNNSSFDYQLPSTNTFYGGPAPYSMRFDHFRPSPLGLSNMNYAGSNTSNYTNGSTSYYAPLPPTKTFSMTNYTPTSPYSSNYIPGSYLPTTIGSGLTPSWNVNNSFKPTCPLTTNLTNSYMSPLPSDPYTSISNKPYTDLTSHYSSFNTTAAPSKSPVDKFSKPPSNIPQPNKQKQDTTAINSTFKDNHNTSPSL
jgi:hypothetical protein